MNRRKIVLGASVAIPAMLTEAVAERPRRPTWVRLRATGSGYAISVNDELDVDLASLDAAVLRQAMSSNFGMSAADVRHNVRIYIRSEAGVPYSAVVDVMNHMSFEHIGLVGESRAD